MKSSASLYQTPLPLGNTLRYNTAMLDRLMQGFFRHWLGIVTGLVAAYGGLAWLAPWLEVNGYAEQGHWLFHLYSPFCHQRPDRAFYLQGHQVAVCHRETAIYATVVLGGLLYGLSGRRWQALPMRWMALLTLPIVVDGITHLIDDYLPMLGLRAGPNDIGSFNWWLRMLTGVLFGLAVVGGVFPRFERDLRGELKHKVIEPVSAAV